MAKPTTRRQVQQFPFVVDPAAVPQPLTFLVPPKGMDTQLRLNQMGRGTSRLVQNLQIRDNHYVARDGTSIVGDISSTQLLYATSIKLSTGRTWNLRWRTTGVDYLSGGVWVPCGGAVYNAPNTSQVVVTGWNDTLVFTVGVGQLMVLSFVNNAPTVTVLTDSPSNVGHVTTYAGRIIASLRASPRIQWCVKNDNTRWDPTDPLNQGAGFEDLLSAPGGGVDQQTAVSPISDEYAYAIRTNSVWQMTLTGNPDAPFRFTVLYQGIGCEYPGAVAAVHRGVCFPSRDNVMMITPDGKREIGQPIRELVRVDKKYLRDASGAFDERNNVYVLSIPTDNSLNAHPIYHFNLDSGGEGPGGWVKDVYPFPVKAISFVRYSQGISIDQLTGAINQLQGAIDDLGQSDRTVGMMMAMAGTSRLVARNTASRNNDAERDVNSAGVEVEGGWRVETGYIIPERTTKMVSLVQVEIEYESDADTELVFEYSTDGGVTWTQYAARNALATTRPKILRVRQTIEREAIQLAINCAATPNFRLIGLHAYASSGSMSEDAR